MNADLGLALALADRADAITVAAFGKSDLIVETKADRTPVSEADRAVEEDVRRQLAVDRPGDRVVGEEFGDTGSGPRRWIIDPIDGTKNFVRRIPVWATLLALEVDGVITTGVVSAPALGRRWWASRGEGAWVDAGSGPSRISVSRVADLADVHVSGASLGSWDDWGGPGVYLELAARCYADRSFGDFWSHVLVAEGVCDIGLDPIVSLWDLAPLQVIVEEAGGRFTDFGGQARADGGSAISSNGLVHEAARAILIGAGT
ncbi:MAG TPA: inositol monophosphatase family protein [Acidimicrobiales bacterium]|jgi:histidinol-phosphatase|nr:inositol monophosphatase family protein [Acidimicrobiales bacterium]